MLNIPAVLLVLLLIASITLVVAIFAAVLVTVTRPPARLPNRRASEADGGYVPFVGGCDVGPFDGGGAGCDGGGCGGGDGGC